MTRQSDHALRQEIRRRGLPTTADPSAAFDLLRNRSLIEWAADPWRNPAWHQARISTRGRDGVAVWEAFTGRQDIQRWADRAEALLRQDIASIRARVPPLKVAAFPKLSPWDPAYDESKMREIVVPCNFRRVLSAHLAYILSVTTQGRLSKAAKAYVPGLVDPARRVAREAATLIREGRYYYVKLDIKDAFNSIPWKPLRKALQVMGYPQRFIDILMAFVEAPTERRVRGQWLQQPRHSGALAGLPESAILLNILLREVDEDLLRECEGFYNRYSDDLLMAEEDGDDVADAAGIFLNWSWKVGFEIKDVPRRTDPKLLVKDIRDHRLELLGVEVDHQGDTHMPQRKVDGYLSKLAYREREAIVTPPLVVGRSKYSAGRRSRGLVTTDQEDLEDLIWSTHRYWYPLNTAEADLLLAVASAHVSSGTYRRAHGPNRKLFVAELGPKSPRPLSRAGDGSGSPLPPAGEWVAREALSITKDLLSYAHEATDTAHRRPCSRVPQMTGYSQEDVRLSPCVPLTLGCGASVDDFDGGVLHSDRTIARGFTTYSVASPARLSSGFDMGASRGLTEVDTRDIAPANPVDDSARLMGSSTGSIANAVFCFISSRRVADAVLTGFQEFVNDGLEMSPRAAVIRGPEVVEREVAYLRLIDHRRRAAATEGRTLIILGPSWLPKQLLSAERSFRRLGIFELVIQVHRGAERDQQRVFIIGPIRTPASLSSALDMAVERIRIPRG